MVVFIPPKVSILTLMGILKGKLAIKEFESYPILMKKPYWGNHFWTKGYFVSTIGLDEDKIIRYVKYQHKEEKLIKNKQKGFDFWAPYRSDH